MNLSPDTPKAPAFAHNIPQGLNQSTKAMLGFRDWHPPKEESKSLEALYKEGKTYPQMKQILNISENQLIAEIKALDQAGKITKRSRNVTPLEIKIDITKQMLDGMRVKQAIEQIKALTGHTPAQMTIYGWRKQKAVQEQLSPKYKKKLEQLAKSGLQAFKEQQQAKAEAKLNDRLAQTRQKLIKQKRITH